jgi:enterochelin esterase-like enzyme
MLTKIVRRASAATLLLSGLAWAQQPTSPNDSLVSPLVTQDGTVIIQIYAPRATDVGLIGDWMTDRTAVPLVKDEAGVWVATIESLKPDYYSYTLIVDGVRTLDPKNPMIKQGNTSVDNMFLVPGEDVAYAMNQRVPHGSVRQVWYYSETLDQQRRMHVYTPPGYDESRSRYPVLYLLHGGGDEDSGWSTIGRAGFILDNLIAAGNTEPMLVVMPNGSLPPVPEVAGATRAARRAESQARFSHELMDSVVPYVESRFRVRTDPDHRAIAGLSMGGGHTMRVLSDHPDQFAYVAIWSSGLFSQSPEDYVAANREFLASPERVNEAVKLLSIVVGEDDFVLPGARGLAQVYASHGIDHEFALSGGGHTWMNWRAYLRDYAPRLFR